MRDHRQRQEGELEEGFFQRSAQRKGGLALPVIPHLKISDRGMVDVDRFMLIG